MPLVDVLKLVYIIVLINAYLDGGLFLWCAVLCGLLVSRFYVGDGAD